MTPGRFNCEMLDRPRLHRKRDTTGYHYCSDWDYMLVVQRIRETGVAAHALLTVLAAMSEIAGCFSV